MSQQPRRKQKKIRSQKTQIRRKPIRRKQIRRKQIRREQVSRKQVRGKQMSRKQTRSRNSHIVCAKASGKMTSRCCATTTRWCGWLIKSRKTVALLISCKSSSSWKKQASPKAQLWSMSVWCVMQEASGQLIVRSQFSRTGVSHLICHQSLSVHVSCTCMHA